MLLEGSHDSQLKVRGISVISLREYVRANLDPTEFGHFMTNMFPADVDTIMNAKRSSWYPFSLQRKLRKAIANHFNPHYPEKAIFEAGLFAASYEISTFLKGMLGNVPLHLILGNVNLIWKKYYNQGTLNAVRERNGVSIHLNDFRSDALFCPLLDAWFKRVFSTIGFRNVTTKKESCIHTGDKCCTWAVTWKSPPPGLHE